MNQAQIDAFIRHQTYIDRFGGGLANRMLELFDNDELLALVMSKKRFKKKIESILKKDRKAANKLMTSELRQMAKLQQSFMQELSLNFKDFKMTQKDVDKFIQQALEKPLVVSNNTPQDLYNSAFDRKEQIATSLDSMNSFDLKDASTINAEMAAMFSQFARSITATDKTLTSAVNAAINEEAFNQSSAVDRVVISAVLDGRTTKFCMGIDGTIYPKDVGPRAPFHARCRTLNVPLVEGQTDEDAKELLSFRPQVKAGDNYKKGEDTKLRSHKRQIEKGKVKVLPNDEGNPTSESYGNFLASQTKTKQGKQFIKDRIGVKKGNAFIQLTEQGVDPQTALKRLLVTPAKDIDLDGLAKRIKKNTPKGGGGSSTPISSTPTKKIESLITPLKTGSKSGVFLDSFNDEQKESIYSGLKDSIGKYNGKLNSVKESTAKSYLGVTLSTGDYIKFSKNQVNNIDALIEGVNKRHKEKTVDRIKSIKQSAKENNPRLRPDWKDLVKKLEVNKRYAIFCVVDDPLRNAALHEGFHNVYFMNNRIEDKFETMLRKYNVDEIDILGVSEYADTNKRELFAEIGAAIEDGVKIPKNVERAFRETLKVIK